MSILDDNPRLSQDGYELRHRLAIYLGYNAELGNAGGWEIFDPDNSHVGMSFYDLDESWSYVLFQVMPNYTTDLNAAWTLIPEMQSGFYFYLSNTGYPARCRVGNQQTGETIVDVLGDTPSLAVCLAWLEWRDIADAAGGQGAGE